MVVPHGMISVPLVRCTCEKNSLRELYKNVMRVRATPRMYCLCAGNDGVLMLAQQKNLMQVRDSSGKDFFSLFRFSCDGQGLFLLRAFDR